MDLIGTIESAVFSHDVGMKYKDSGYSQSQALPSSHLWRWCHHLKTLCEKPVCLSLFLNLSDGKGLRQTGCLLYWGLSGIHPAERQSTLIMDPPFHPLLTGQWPLGLYSWSVYSQSQLHLGTVQRVLGTHVLSHLSCLQEWIFLVYKCMYLVTMLLCVYESDTMQKLWNVLLKGLKNL